LDHRLGFAGRLHCLWRAVGRDRPTLTGERQARSTRKRELQGLTPVDGIGASTHCFNGCSFACFHFLKFPVWLY
jgi:hypothetical protein